MNFTFNVETRSEEFKNITDKVSEFVRESGVSDGLCVVFCPHTTAGITINENADPDVVRDMLTGLRAAYPERSDYRHFEGNTTAHLKASAVGSSASVPISGGRLSLGRWQGIYLCEFDGPRTRRVIMSVMG